MNTAPDQPPATPAHEELAPMARVISMTGCSRTRIYAEIKAGRFPLPLKIWGRSLWVVSEVQAWIRFQVDTCPRMPSPNMGENMGNGDAHKKTPEKSGVSRKNWRRGGDSNPRYAHTYA